MSKRELNISTYNRVIVYFCMCHLSLEAVDRKFTLNETKYLTLAFDFDFEYLKPRRTLQAFKSHIFCIFFVKCLQTHDI